jgi:hypothetical protein
MRLLIRCTGALLVGCAWAQTPVLQLSTKIWPASWIEVPGTPPEAYGVYHFRRTFDLPSKPDHFVVYVSGDNRYQLFANGKRVSWGPARSDLTHWRYETVDLAAELSAGKNVLAAVVWNDGPDHAVAQVTNRTGFVLQAETPEDQVVNTNRNWKGMLNAAYRPAHIPPDQIAGYYALSPNEHVDAHSYPWGWDQPGFDDSSWQPAHELTHAAPRDAQDAPNRWMLTPRPIPLEQQSNERIKVIRGTNGVAAPEGFLEGHSPLRVPPRSHVSLLLDQTYLTTAYPELTVSDGDGSTIELHYAETLYIALSSHGKPSVKGNRNDVAGRIFAGPWDTFVTDGGQHRLYRPLYWRTYRYVLLTVETAQKPLVIEDFHGVFSGYPFTLRAGFQVRNPDLNQELQNILTTGWRTARLCAHETYMDCPFYEQLQYVGDTRIQALVSLYTSGDSRLMRNAIEEINSSRTAEGATYSRAPSSLQQYIPPFSLWWIGMLHDYWMYVDDPQLVRQMLPGVRAVLGFYARYNKPDGSLVKMPWWNFVDWVTQWKDGEPPANQDGSSAAALDLQHVLAYHWAADLEQAEGDSSLAAEDERAAAHLRETIQNTDWDARRGLFADQPEHLTYSQQVNTLAVLAQVVSGDRAKAVMEKVITDRTLAQSSIYFLAYTNAALREAGLGDRYIDMLEPWREMLANGLTTWAEVNGTDTRSDCHAWGASPNFELLRTVAGIEPSAAGFKQIRIAPNLGALDEVIATMPYPGGDIHVHLKRTRGRLAAEITLPGTLTGEFEFSGQKLALRGGANHLEVALPQ